MVRLKLIMPDYEMADSQPISLLKTVGERLGLRTSTERFTKVQMDEMKFKMLLPLAVSKRIGIKQTRKTKSLYPQLLVLFDDELFTFYPQRYADKEITIEEFLDGLARGDTLCLHDKATLDAHFSKGRRSG